MEVLLLIIVYFGQDFVAAQTGVGQNPVTELLLGYFQWVFSCATEANPAPYSGSWILWCPTFPQGLLFHWKIRVKDPRICLCQLPHQPPQVFRNTHRLLF